MKYTKEQKETLTELVRINRGPSGTINWADLRAAPSFVASGLNKVSQPMLYAMAAKAKKQAHRNGNGAVPHPVVDSGDPLARLEQLEKQTQIALEALRQQKANLQAQQQKLDEMLAKYTEPAPSRTPGWVTERL